MIAKIRKSQVSAEIAKEKGIKGIYIEPQPPTRERFYTGHLSDVGQSVYLTVQTKEKEDID